MSHPATRTLAVKLLALAGGLMACAAVWGGTTRSTFDRTTTSPGNSVSTGSAVLRDNDGGSAPLSLTGAKAGDSSTSCVVVTYTGSDSHVSLYGTVGGTGLADNLTLTVTRGTIPGTPTSKSCTGFTADSTDYAGYGAGIVFRGALSAFPQSLGTAIVDPVSGSAVTWTSGMARAYKLVATMGTATGTAVQGKTASAVFTWQATTL